MARNGRCEGKCEINEKKQKPFTNSAVLLAFYPILFDQESSHTISSVLISLLFKVGPMKFHKSGDVPSSTEKMHLNVG